MDKIDHGVNCIYLSHFLQCLYPSFSTQTFLHCRPTVFLNDLWLEERKLRWIFKAFVKVSKTLCKEINWHKIESRFFSPFIFSSSIPKRVFSLIERSNQSDVTMVNAFFSYVNISSKQFSVSFL